MRADRDADDFAASIAAGLEGLRDRRDRIFYFVPYSIEHVVEVGRQAIRMGLVGPDYAWTMPLEGAGMLSFAKPEDIEGIFDFLRGAGAIGATSRGPGPKWARLDAILRRQNASDYAYLNTPTTETDTRAADAKWPDQSVYDEGLTFSTTGFVYDAIASVGIGACLTKQVFDRCGGSAECERDALDGDTLLAVMKTEVFEGVSGPVRYDQSTGSRLAESATYLVKNLVPNAAGDGLDLIEVGYESKLITGEPGWTLTRDFTFFDGTSTPPSDGIVDTQSWERLNVNVVRMGFFTQFTDAKLDPADWRVQGRKTRPGRRLPTARRDSTPAGRRSSTRPSRRSRSTPLTRATGPSSTSLRTSTRAARMLAAERSIGSLGCRARRRLFGGSTLGFARAAAARTRGRRVAVAISDALLAPR